VSRPTFLVPLVGGGFALETSILLAPLRDRANFIYLTTMFGGVPGKGSLPAGEKRDIPQCSTVTRKSSFADVRALATTFTVTAKLILRRPIDAVIGIGASHVFPMMLAGRILRKKTIFIETITRADRLSNTGWLVYHLRLADQFFVQWPELQRKYPRASLGTIL